MIKRYREWRMIKEQEEDDFNLDDLDNLDLDSVDWDSLDLEDSERDTLDNIGITVAQIPDWDGFKAGSEHAYDSVQEVFQLWKGFGMLSDTFFEIAGTPSWPQFKKWFLGIADGGNWKPVPASVDLDDRAQPLVMRDYANAVIEDLGGTDNGKVIFQYFTGDDWIELHGDDITSLFWCAMISIVDSDNIISISQSESGWDHSAWIIKDTERLKREFLDTLKKEGISTGAEVIEHWELDDFYFSDEAFEEFEKLSF